MGITIKAIAAVALLGLVACGEPELILDGERVDVREDARAAAVDAAVAAALDGTPLARGFEAPEPRNYSSWTHRGGDITHNVEHPALAAELSQLFAVDIGQGNERKARLTADPVVADNRVFAMDSASRVTALGTDGTVQWASDLVPETDEDGDATGGGLAFGEDTLFAATGFGELFALDPETGATRWRQKLDAPLTSSPTVSDGQVYVVTRDSRAWALDVSNGRINWQLAGAPSEATLLGGSGPVITPRVAVLPFGSGDMVGALKKSGIQVWGTAVVGQRRGRAYANITDITGDPVAYDGVIYAANASGSIAAIKPNSGERIWTANEGAYSPVLPVGDSVFMISDQGELLRLDRETGTRIWGERLPYFVDRKIKRRQAIYAHYGPVLAGGRLIVASDDGLIRSYDPATGGLLGTTPIAGGAASNPAIVDGVMYVLTTKGQLAAFR